MPLTRDQPFRALERAQRQGAIAYRRQHGRLPTTNWRRARLLAARPDRGAQTVERCEGGRHHKGLQQTPHQRAEPAEQTASCSATARQPAERPCLGHRPTAKSHHAANDPVGARQPGFHVRLAGFVRGGSARIPPLAAPDHLYHQLQGACVHGVVVVVVVVEAHRVATKQVSKAMRGPSHHQRSFLEPGFRGVGLAAAAAAAAASRVRSERIALPPGSSPTMYSMCSQLPSHGLRSLALPPPLSGQSKTGTTLGR